MNTGRTMTAATSILLLIAVAVPLAGCGTSEAKPLEVTYYYLPG